MAEAEASTDLEVGLLPSESTLSSWHPVWRHVVVEDTASGNNTFLIRCKHCSWGQKKRVAANTTKLKNHFRGLNLVFKCSKVPDELSDLLQTVCYVSVSVQI